MVSLKSRFTGAPLLKIAARADCSSKRHIRTCRNGDVPEIELDRLSLHSEELIPRRHIGVEAA